MQLTTLHPLYKQASPSEARNYVMLFAESEKCHLRLRKGHIDFWVDLLIKHMHLRMHVTTPTRAHPGAHYHSLSN